MYFLRVPQWTKQQQRLRGTLTIPTILRRRMLEAEQKRWLQADKEADHGSGISAMPDSHSDGASPVA